MPSTVTGSPGGVPALDDGPVEALGGGLQPRQREAALGAAQHHTVRRDEPRVHDMSDMADIIVVRAVVYEDPEADADLVRGEADALGRVHRREHVLDECRELGPEGVDLRTCRAQHGVAEQGEGPDAPAGARDGALSHGGKGTVL